MTIEAWVNPYSLSTSYLEHRIIDGFNVDYISSTGCTTQWQPGANYGLSIDQATGRPQMRVKGDNGYIILTAVNGSSASPGIWTHIVGTYDINTGTRIYTNGILTGYDPDTTHIGTIVTIDNSNCYVFSSGTFGQGNNGANSYDGLIDEVRIYNRALTADEIQARYNAFNH